MKKRQNRQIRRLEKVIDELMKIHDDGLDELTLEIAPLHLQGGATAEPCNGESDCSQIR